MTQNADNVRSAKPNVDGVVWSAPYGTVLPTNAVDDLDPAFACLGYLSEDGYVEATELSSDTKKAFGGDEVYSAQTGHSVKATFTPIEHNVHALKETYGEDNVGVDDAGRVFVKINAKPRKTRSYVIEMLIDDNELERTVIEKGKVTAVGERSYKDGELLGSQLEVTALTGSDGDKVKKYYAELGDTNEEITEGGDGSDPEGGTDEDPEAGTTDNGEATE